MYLPRINKCHYPPSITYNVASISFWRDACTV